MKNCTDLQILHSENGNISKADFDAREIRDKLVAVGRIIKSFITVCSK